MARTGVLSDAYIRKHSPELFPLDAYSHENLYGQPLVQKRVHKRKERPRRVDRPRAPYMMHHEFAKMMSTMNVKAAHDAF